MFLLLNWLNELNMKKANEKICSKTGHSRSRFVDLQEKATLFKVAYVYRKLFFIR